MAKNEIKIGNNKIVSTKPDFLKNRTLKLVRSMYGSIGCTCVKQIF